MGFIYCLKHPLTGEIFYVGSTQYALQVRLRTHYTNVRECIAGTRKINNRVQYLIDLLPLKAEICLLELVQNQDLDEREIFFIKKLRAINPKLTNMTDGGKGACTSKYYTEAQMGEYTEKLSRANAGKCKPQSFKDHLSKIRKGINNPAVKEMTCGWLICFKDSIPVRMFKYSFEINDFIGTRNAAPNVQKRLSFSGSPYGYQWMKFENCTEEIQDIVQSFYESKK